MIMKKITAAVCCGALALSVFAGCNGSGGITVNQGAQGLRRTGGAAGEATEITFATGGQRGEKVFESVFKAFEEENKDIKVNYLFIPQGEYMTKLSAMAATNSCRTRGRCWRLTPWIGRRMICLWMYPSFTSRGNHQAAGQRHL